MRSFLVHITCVVFFLAGIPASGQHNNYDDIDRQVKAVSAPTPDSLAKLLTQNLETDEEKARAIYSWIAQNISYNTGIFSRTGRQPALPVLREDDDTAVNWSSAIEMTARRVLKKRTAICDGYAKLFHTLCHYAGIRSEIILGYARSGYGDNRFRTNHSWNAVMINGNWQLVDVTWGSGYVNSGSAFVKQPDDKYFLTPPEQFIYDHYPEDLFWTLLKDPPAPSDYNRSPFRLKNFIKYNISSHFPAKGVVEVSPGDSVFFQVELKDLKKASAISPDPFFDSSMFSRSEKSLFIHPISKTGNRVSYQYIAGPEEVKWIYLVFNDDIILRYRVKSTTELAFAR